MQYLVAFSVLFVVAFGFETDDNSYNITIRLENAVSSKPDDLVCTSIKLDPEETYINLFNQSKKIAVESMSFLNGTQTWQCDAPDGDNSEKSVCQGGERQILFAWAMDAPPKSLPEDVGIRVSGGTGINHLVVQLHYAFKFPEGLTDNSGVTLTLNHQRPPMQAGYLILANIGYIPPQEIAHPMDSYCMYERDYSIYPIGFRTHAHELGYVTAGYRVREGRWTEIGRMSPQLPETFYQVSNPGIEIRRGDQLASRCTMNSMSRNDITKIGTTHHDEMCNFYIMYATYHQEMLRTDYCFQSSPGYRWSDTFSLEEIPKDVSSLRGIQNAERVLQHFNMTKLL